MMPASLLKRGYRKILGRKPVRPVTFHSKTTRHGSRYGGWNILDKHLNSESIVYSAGVGEDSTFDQSLINHYGLSIHAFDPTPAAINHIKQLRQSEHIDDHFILHEYAIGTKDDVATFTLPSKPGYVSGSLEKPMGGEKIEVRVRSLPGIMKELGHQHIDLLKLDIEGSEFPVLTDFVAQGISCVQIAVEVHPSFFADGEQRTTQLLDLLLNNGYQIFHVSKVALEYSLVRPDLLS